MENNWLHLMDQIKRILLLAEIEHYLKNKKTFNELVEERSFEFWNLKTN